jgi:hypothetical protein
MAAELRSLGTLKPTVDVFIASTAKQSGMFWHVTGAQSVLSTRCAVLGHIFDDDWTHRNAA